MNLTWFLVGLGLGIAAWFVALVFLHAVYTAPRQLAIGRTVIMGAAHVAVISFMIWLYYKSGQADWWIGVGALLMLINLILIVRREVWPGKKNP